MSIAKVTFKKIIQDSQEYGSDDEHTVSRIFFDLELDGDSHTDLRVDVKHTVGSDFETTPLEVGPPQGYDGPFNHDAFRIEAEKYYREAFGSSGTAIHIEDGSNIRMMNNIVFLEKVLEFEVEGRPTGW